MNNLDEQLGNPPQQNPRLTRTRRTINQIQSNENLHRQEILQHQHSFLVNISTQNQTLNYNQIHDRQFQQNQ